MPHPLELQNYTICAECGKDIKDGHILPCARNPMAKIDPRCPSIEIDREYEEAQSKG